jgi:FkbM family methyltransferase
MINIFKIKQLVRNIFPKYSTKIFSQEGEDMILNRYYDSKKNGFYIDIGAHHPIRFSNTYLFYKKGWNGVNIDAMPGSMILFNKLRPRDKNIEQAISKNQENLTFYIYKEKALNTFSKDLVNYRDSLNIGCNAEKHTTISTKRLDDVLSEILPKNQIIDFMTIDVEGYDLEVLQSNNWLLFKPRLILIEILSSSYEDINSNPISLYLKIHGYKIYAKCINTVFFIHISEHN